MAVATGDVRRTAAVPIALAFAVLAAAPATAVPECTDIAPNTRICQTPGHLAIVTSPNPALTNPYPGWGYGPLGFGLGGMWIGR
jgi:hypothetical protein